MNKRQKRKVELQRHVEKFIDRARWPDFQPSQADWDAYWKLESSGVDDGVPEALLWAKKLEEITIGQMWHEMADWWSKGNGWYYVWRSNFSRAWADRRGTNVGIRKLLAQYKLITRKRSFLAAMLSCSYFNDGDRERYIGVMFGERGVYGGDS